jgi:hypothetical protein
MGIFRQAGVKIAKKARNARETGVYIATKLTGVGMQLWAQRELDRVDPWVSQLDRVIEGV